MDTKPTLACDAFTVGGTALPDDAERINALTGNDEIKLCVDARGAMHDFKPSQGSWSPPRIVWTGRRHGQTINRYNSNLFEWGFVDVRLAGEEQLGEVVHWRQRLRPRHGVIETEIEHACGARMTAESFVHLENNVIIFHRRYERLPKRKGGWRAKAVWTFCQVGTDQIPYRTTFTPQPAWDNGCAADTTADGIIPYRGRIALLANGPAKAKAVANRLEVEAPLAADGSVTFCLLLADDLGNDPQLLDMPLDIWMSPPVREINREIRAMTIEKPDPVATVDGLRGWVAAQGYAGLLSLQQKSWQAYFDRFTLELPAAEAELRAVLDTQLYTIRCSYSHFSLPATPFNPSWGAGYFWDEQFPMLGLMACGEMEMPRRILEYRRRTLIMATRMTGGHGSRFPSCASESGQHISDRNSTHIYQFHLVGYLANYTWLYCKYLDDEAVWRRYYPLIRECAQFFRKWLLIELPGHYAMIVPGIDVDESVSARDDGPAVACGAAVSLHMAAELAGKLNLNEPDAPEWRRLSKLASRLARDIGAGFYSEFNVGMVPEPDEPDDPAIVEWRRQARERCLKKQDGIEHSSAAVSGDPEMVSEWAWGHLNTAYVHANKGEADKALEQLRRVPPLRLDFAALCESCSPDKSRIHHPWFTTGAGALLRTLTRMLLISDGDTIRLFPGLPHGAWEELEFRLRAQGNIKVCLRMASGVIQTLELSRCGSGPRRCRVLIPDGYVSAALLSADWIVRQANGLTEIEVEVNS